MHVGVSGGGVQGVFVAGSDIRHAHALHSKQSHALCRLGDVIAPTWAALRGNAPAFPFRCGLQEIAFGSSKSEAE